MSFLNGITVHPDYERSVQITLWNWALFANFHRFSKQMTAGRAKLLAAIAEQVEFNMETV